ncbi:ABC transporter permease [Spirochaeta africana]|uniref:ABC-type transport system, involved in lipoprotein release, permease component n=1 Tax=Spirochaeta africana (strain ATCC 700263 / DSM 8902 / Z-7692) TaxID=889378 RepID=H9UFK3_SPIAZ|nr:FtsX-like permease family protein [Spirochaeta africana]AFG36296.1 ABC-type transport system, involved in lipoprotein release, permease component [Spirochaeta africana DSM 8902]
MFLKLAVVSLGKHRKRTLLILFAVMISVLVMEVVAGVFHGVRVNFFETLTQEGGHLQITARGRSEALNPYSLEYTIAEYEQVISKVHETARDQGVAVTAAEEVLEFGALLQHSAAEERNLTLSGVGVRPDTAYYSRVREAVQGAFPPPSGGIAISASIAELLAVEQGDELLLVVEDSTGSPFYLQFLLAGVFRTDSSELDENTVFISHQDAQELVYLEGETTGIRVRLQNHEQAEVLADVLRARFQQAADRGEIAAALRVETYRDLHAGLMGMIDLLDFFIVLMNLCVIIVAASVITNAILMNVFDRIREFGTMRAIGLKRLGAARIILVEGLLQGVAGSLLGLAVGIPIVLYFSVHGLDWGGISEAFGMGSAQFRFGYSPYTSMLNGAGGVLIALAGSLYAAVVGMRLSIMEALRYE